MNSMPNHHENSLGHMVARVRRWTSQGLEARRTAWRVPEEAPADAGQELLKKGY